MNREQVEQRIEDLASDQSNENNHDYEDFKAFLAESVTGDIPLYINRRQGPFLYSFLLPNGIEINVDHIGDINKWNFDAISIGAASTIYSISSFDDGKEKKEISLDDNPMSGCASQILNFARPLFFHRARDLDDHDSYFLELEQTLSHALDLSSCPNGPGESNWAHYRLGGGFDVVASGSLAPYCLLTIDSKYLELYLHVSKSRLLRVFDFPRVTQPFQGWVGLGYAESRLSFDKNPIYAKHHKQEGAEKSPASYIRGFQIFDRFEDEVKSLQFYSSHW